MNARTVFKHAVPSLALLVALGSTRPALAQDGGIEVFAANTLFERGTRVSLSYIYERKGTLLQGSDEVSDPLDLLFQEHRIVAGVDHGVRRDLTLSALLPVVYKSLESNAGDVHSSGLGDLALLAKFRAAKHDWDRSTFNLSTIVGLEVPTGQTHERGPAGRLPPELQPGQGAWNPFFGLSANASLDRLRFDALAFYKVNTEGAQDFERGDFLALGVDAAYRFLHTKYPGPTASAKLGFQWRYEGQALRDGTTVADSGLQELRLRPGFSWHPAPGIDISLAVEIPLHQYVEGQQLALDLRTFLAIGLRF